MAEKRSRILRNGKHCLSEASCKTAGVGEYLRESNGPRRGKMVLGPFAETKELVLSLVEGTSSAEAKPGLNMNSFSCFHLNRLKIPLAID